MANSVYLERLIKNLKREIGKDKNLSDELAEILSLSKESVYRRLRGETPFNLDELMHLRQKYNISLDSQTTSAEGTKVEFLTLFNNDSDLNEYFLNIKKRFQLINTHPNTVTYNAAENLPFFRQLGYEHLAAFKHFFWCRSILNKPEFQHQIFSLNNENNELKELFEDIFTLYNQVNSTEIWTNHTIKGTITQIEYYADCGLIDSQQTILALYQDLANLIIDLRDQARSSKKLLRDGQAGGDFKLFLCELSLDNNYVLLYTDQPSFVAIGFNTFNSVQSTDKRLLDECWAWFQAMLEKSIPVSGISERFRFEFYKQNMELITKSAEMRLSSEWFLKLKSQ